MKKVIAIGEALIDFIPHEKGRALNDVENFLRVPGGAPLNVAAAVAKLGGKSQMLTKLGQDGFGDAILNEVKPLGVDVPVLAFGLGIERLAMIRYDISDIRMLYKSDIKWLRELPTTNGVRL